MHFEAITIAILQSYFSAMAYSCPAHVDMTLLSWQYITYCWHQCKYFAIHQ